MNFKSLPQLLDYFKTEQICIEYYENIRWKGNPSCPFCGTTKAPYKTNRGYKCSEKLCHKKFTVKVGTIFENSKIPFRIWLAAIWLCTAHKKGISSVQVGIDLNVTQKTAWFVLHRIREMLKQQKPEIIGGSNAVEIDESFIGGREDAKHYKKRRSDENPSLKNDGTPYVPKKVVVGIIERNGNVILKYVPAATKENMVPFIEQYVPKGTKIFTDESNVYAKIGTKYEHGTVQHNLKIYVSGDCHTNTIESFWAILKRGIYGIYHQVSEKHFERYLNEFASRYNARKDTPQDRIEKFLNDSERRLKYADLIAKTESAGTEMCAVRI
ncbi:MAG TPA: IS1595 family transposase [Bacteroidia bacterium]|nr:IS1595 family transposase [Bacteroidia bacterium]